MRITLLSVGTHGDVEPCLALALGLGRAGYDVTLAAGTNFESFVTGRGVRFAPIRADYLAWLQSDEGRALLARRGPVRLFGRLPECVWEMKRRTMEDAREAARGADAIVYHSKVLGAYDVAEKMGVPTLMAEFMPHVPTSRFPSPLAPRLPLGRAYNRLSYRLARLWQLPQRGLRNRWRVAALGLPPKPWYADDLRRRGRALPVLYAFSPHVLPRPDDWPASATVTGFWFLNPPTAWSPPADLQAFLDAGPPPVYVGFGSMVSRDARRVTGVVVEALRKTGQRGVLAAGWGGLAKAGLPDTVFPVDAVPHAWLFPRVAAVVHHGGMGTTAAGLRAGRPTVVCPFFHDQPFWGRRVWELGAGPRPVPQAVLSADRLAAAIRAATEDEGVRQRAAALGAKIRAEDGVARAVGVVQAHLSGGA
jgi:sterol 3beta-glucosyltransferase